MQNAENSRSLKKDLLQASGVMKGLPRLIKADFGFDISTSFSYFLKKNIFPAI